MEKSARITASVVTITRRGADRIRAGHVWVYRSDVVDATGAGPGSVVLIQEQARAGSQRREDKSVPSASLAPRRATRPGAPRLLGSAFYSTVADIEGLVRERIRAAIAYRERFVQNTNAYRVIFSEGDFLPGLIVDRYNDILSVQVLTQAMDVAEMRQTLVDELRLAFQPRAIVERVDARVRKLEQLPEKESGVIWQETLGSRSMGDGGVTGVSPVMDHSETNAADAANGRGRPAPHSQLTTEFQMNGVRFLYDALEGQKTGAFLDQRENYAAAAQNVRGEALDVFCYQGGFALHLARKCSKVIGVDSSRPALERAERNAALNGREIEWIEANAFDLLRDYSDAG